MSRVVPCAVSCLLATLTACGESHQQKPLDAVVDTTMVDGLPAGCDYVEKDDVGNDDVPPATGGPEATGLTFSTQSTICGTIDASHFDGDITVDVDGYTITIPTETDVLVRLGATGAEAIEFVGVDIYGGAGFTTHIGALTFYGDHGVTSVHLTAGTYELSAFALNSAAITTNVSYTLAVIADAPALRCPELTTGGYVETNDGGSNNGNDVITIPSGSPPALTTSGADNPEPTSLTLSPSMGDQRISGSSANITTTDQYEDKDTYAFSTSPMTNELTVRLTWPGTTANLDFYLFEATTTDPVVRALDTATSAPEARTFSVKPSTSYWLLVGTKAGSTGFPVSYSASLCPAHFVP